MIQTLSCPNCKRTLVLATEASLQAVLRCRHCSHQFVLGEMVEAEMGYWEVVDDPRAPEAVVGVAGDVVTDDAEIELAESEEYISPQTLLLKQAGTKRAEETSLPTIPHEQYERVRRKPKSSVWSMVSVLLGGLASIPIATLLIWHVLGKDPLQMGPAVARYAPWIVPTRFQANRFERFNEDNPPAAPPSGASGFRRFDNELNPSKDSSATTETSSEAEPLGSEPSEVDSGSSAEQSSDKAAPAGTPLATDNASNDVFTALHQVEKDLKAWNERGDDRELQKKLALQTYSNLTALALAIHELPSASPQRRLVRTELHSVGQQVAQHTDIQQLIQSGSRYWLLHHQDDLIGLAVVISVARATEVDHVWQITPATAIGEETIQVTAPNDILPSLSDGQKLLVIGCLTRAKTTTNSEPADLAPKPTSTFMANYVYVLEP